LPDRNTEREELCYRYIEQKQIVLMGINKKKRRKKNEREREERKEPNLG
jgi:hypothetical protein